MQHIQLTEKSVIGETLTRVRKVARVSQVELGRVLDLHQSAISRIESGEQHMSPDELLKICQHFDISTDALLTGCINYWALAEKFFERPPYPHRYREHAYSTVRSIMPILYFVSKKKGQPALQSLLRRHDLDSLLFQCPDQKIGIYVVIDLFSDLITGGLLSNRSWNALIEETRRPEIHGFLDRVYRVQNTPAKLLQALILNSAYYDSNFSYSLETTRTGATLEVAPQPHMEKVLYKTEVLGDAICRYRRDFVAQFPKYIGKPDLAVTERQCHFQGAKSCVYELAL